MFVAGFTVHDPNTIGDYCDYEYELFDDLQLASDWILKYSDDYYHVDYYYIDNHFIYQIDDDITGLDLSVFIDELIDSFFDDEMICDIDTYNLYWKVDL
jgi:hypothetical protein